VVQKLILLPGTGVRGGKKARYDFLVSRKGWKEGWSERKKGCRKKDINLNLWKGSIAHNYPRVK